MVADLSAEGCQISSPTRVRPGAALRLRISLAEINLHIQVAKAEVRWARGKQFGIQFQELTDEENRHLRQALSEFEKARKT